MRKQFTILLFFLLSFGSAFSQILIVSFDIQPENSIVFVDGQRIELENGRTELVPGKHQIRILKNGFDEINEEIKVSRKKAYFKFLLPENPNRLYPEDDFVEETKPATLFIETYENATVLFNDSVILANLNIILPPQKAIIKVFAEKTDTISQEVQLFSEEKIQLSLFPEMIIQKEDIKIDMILVKKGEFSMGKPGSKSNARLHMVQIDDFYISKFEVTQELWQMVMKDNPSKRQGNQLPVENVSWEDVQTFISKLNKITEKTYRLPTEAEWEYAARGGHKIEDAQKYSGSKIIDSVAWYWRNSGDQVLEGRWDNESMKQNNCRIREVGQKQPNALGIYDMTGNLWEWCSDWYGEEYYLESPLSNPQGPKEGIQKVCRGGSFLSKASFCRNGFRFSYPPRSSYSYLGFRLVMDLK